MGRMSRWRSGTRGLPGAKGRVHRFRVASIAGAAAGFLGGLACSAAMVLAAAGVIGASAAAGASSMSGMADMDRAHPSDDAGVFRFLLLDHGPTILLASTVLVTFALAMRRRGSAIAAATVGGVMYWGMYVQASVAVMYATIASGLIAWLALVLAPDRFQSRR